MFISFQQDWACKECEEQMWKMPAVMNHLCPFVYVHLVFLKTDLVSNIPFLNSQIKCLKLVFTTEKTLKRGSLQRVRKGKNLYCVILITLQLTFQTTVQTNVAPTNCS